MVGKGRNRNRQVVERLTEVYKITEWRDGAVYKTRSTGEYRWVPLDAPYFISPDIILSSPGTSYEGRTVRVRKEE